ncbi:hypothetical protein ABQE62_07235 [Mycolicibacterium fortuitum]
MGINVEPAVAELPPPLDEPASGVAAGAETEAGVDDTPPSAAGAPNPGDGINVPPAGAPVPDNADVAGPGDGTCCPEPAKPAATADGPDTADVPTPGVT